MARNDSTEDHDGGIWTANNLLAMHQRNLDAMNGAVKHALEGVQMIATRYGDFVSEAHRQFALMLWRGTLSRSASGEERSSVDAARQAIDATFGHVISLAEIAAKLHLESLTIVKHSALHSLTALEPDLRHKPKHPNAPSGLAAS